VQSVWRKGSHLERTLRDKTEFIPNGTIVQQGVESVELNQRRTIYGSNISLLPKLHLFSNKRIKLHSHNNRMLHHNACAFERMTCCVHERIKMYLKDLELFDAHSLNFTKFYCVHEDTHLAKFGAIWLMGIAQLYNLLCFILYSPGHALLNLPQRFNRFSQSIRQTMHSDARNSFRRSGLNWVTLRSKYSTHILTPECIICS
jgi:hypothetical protein